MPSVFLALSVQVFFCRRRELKNVKLWIKRSSLSLSSQPTNQSGGGAGLPTVPRPNNNGEVNIARLKIIYFLY